MKHLFYTIHSKTIGKLKIQQFFLFLQFPALVKVVILIILFKKTCDFQLAGRFYNSELMCLFRPCLHDKSPSKLDIAAEVIVENLGRNWRKLGRKLGLTDVKLESISKRHPTDLEETAVELLKEWRKSKGAEAETKYLIAALRACQQNLTADKVEDRLEMAFKQAINRV
uniref:Death domain-containing protein n=1 Tax=Acanthochromis polyacanthus TaxID=80966 RepID=A0A3Q1GPP7_9TELE